VTCAVIRNGDVEEVATTADIENFDIVRVCVALIKANPPSLIPFE
jgi:hypothetical protein